MGRQCRINNAECRIGEIMLTNKYVKQQYSNDKNLSIRMRLHANHSTNKQGFGEWLWEQYEFYDGCRILELGCGNGAQWENKIDSLPDNCKIILSDFSAGMVDTVRKKYSKHNAFSFEQVDILDIPFAENSFDVVIANHMLYHVPNLDKALSEVKRVLKPKGKFYSTTIGSGGMMPYLHNVIKQFDKETMAFSQQFSFTLQNGYEILSKYFLEVAKSEYHDSLAITVTQDLIDWIVSTDNVDFSEQLIEDLYKHFESIRQTEGTINIPKEAGLFVSLKQ